MAKTSKASEIGANAFHSGSHGGIDSFLDRRYASRFLEAVLSELRTALQASAEHQDLVRRSARQLTRMGLRRADIPEHIRKRYYAG